MTTLQLNAELYDVLRSFSGNKELLEKILKYAKSLISQKRTEKVKHLADEEFLIKKMSEVKISPEIHEMVLQINEAVDFEDERTKYILKKNEENFS